MHVEAVDAVERYLRIFDLDMQYGPCLGQTRLQRWIRADRLGKQPPILVKHILETLDMEDRCVFAECLFYHRV